MSEEHKQKIKPRSLKRHRYTPEQNLWIAQNYKRHSRESASQAFEAEFGVKLTEEVICSRFAYLKSKMLAEVQPVPDGYYSITEAAEIWGIHRNALINRINRGTLPVRRFGRQYYIHQDQFDALDEKQKQITAQLPWPAIKIPEAIKRLGYGQGAINKAIRCGHIDGCKRLETKPSGRSAITQYVRLEDVEALEQFMVENQISDMICGRGQPPGASRWPDFVEYKKALREAAKKGP